MGSPLVVLEKHLFDFLLCLSGSSIEDYGPEYRKSIWRAVKKFIIWYGNIFRLTNVGSRLVAPQSSRPGIL